MKNIINSIIFGLLIFFVASCQEEELRVHFPTSMPVFDNAVVWRLNHSLGWCI